jgi:hypothetical protein
MNTAFGLEAMNGCTSKYFGVAALAREEDAAAIPAARKCLRLSSMLVLLRINHF